MSESPPSEGWRDDYSQLGIPAEDWEDDPLGDLRGREDELEAIAESDAPDAPVARILLALLRGEDLAPADVAPIYPEDDEYA